MKIITKAMEWNETKNPFVDQLVCPCCDKTGATLDPKFLLTDGPQDHVNLSKVDGKLLTTQGRCPHCKSTFLWRVMLSPTGAFSWTDVMVSAKDYNKLMAAQSTDQLPCMCSTCQKDKGLKSDNDESTVVKTALPKTHPKPHNPPVMDAEVVEAQNVTTIAEIVAAKGRMLTDEQVYNCAEAMGYLAATVKEKLTKEQIKDMWETIKEFVEGYVRIKFVTFQPKENDDPTLPPSFPSIVPTIVYANFKAQAEWAHMCQFLVTKCAAVDIALNRPDLAAAVIYTHMCPMCKLSDCIYHPSKREEV